jgi:hypothetical protein
MEQFCGHCGAPIEPADRFCGACGKPNDLAGVPPSPPRPTEERPVPSFAAQPPAPPISAPATTEQETGAWSIAVPDKNQSWSNVPIEKESRIGRHQECEIRIEDTQVSRFHAMLTPIPDGLWLADRGSTNGTYVNGQRISAAARVNDGDVIAVGKTHLTVMSPGRHLADLDRTMAVPRSGVPTDPFAQAHSHGRTCPYCDARVPRTAKSCPNCRRPL